jgi:hypothetical protein
MTSLAERMRLLLDIPRFRHHINRRRRLVAAVLTGLGIVLLIGSMRSPGPSPELAVASSDPLRANEVAVPVLIEPSAAIGALTSGMLIDLVRDGTPTIESARVVEIPSSGFGPTSESIAIVALPRTDAISLASHPNTPVGVMIRPRLD